MVQSINGSVDQLLILFNELPGNPVNAANRRNYPDFIAYACTAAFASIALKSFRFHPGQIVYLVLVRILRIFR